MLKGKAKTDYMRDYMRRKRAGLPTAKSTADKPAGGEREWKPTKRVINQIAYWARVRASAAPWRLRAIGDRVIDGLTLDTDESWMEACRRYKALKDERRAEREKEKEQAAKPKPRYCLFCREPESTERIFVGHGVFLICEKCIAEAAAVVASAKRKARGKKSSQEKSERNV